MKKNILNLALVAAMAFAITACTKKEAAPEAAETSAPAADSSSQVQQDQEVLSNDSATVETAVGVKDEEANAKVQEQKEDQKLKQDEKSTEKK